MGDKREFERCTLYIKKNGCYLCQRVDMIVRLKGLVPDKCDFKLVDEKLRHFEMKDFSAKMPPLLVHKGAEYEDGEEIEAHLEKHFSPPPMICEDKKVTDITERESPISDFRKWCEPNDQKKSQKAAEKLAAYFKRVEGVLGENRSKGDFLDGSTLKFPDCILFPKLYHMKVVAAHITNGGDIFKGYPNIKEYMQRVMKNEHVQKSMQNEIDLTKFNHKPSCDIKHIQGL